MKRKVQTAAGALAAIAVLGYYYDRSRPQSVALGLSRSEPQIRKLHPSIQPMARELLQRAANVGIQLVVTNGLRTNEEQARLYAQGRTAPGPKVTNAKPGTSWHNYGLAFDVAKFDNGKPEWPNDTGYWNRIGAIGQQVGLRWGGNSFGDFKDYPHFEYHPDLTINDAMAGRRPEA